MGYSLGKDRGRFNHLLFMDDLKLYGRNINEIDSQIQTVRIFSQDIGMEFGIQKCAMAFGIKSICFRGSTLWNSIPDVIKSSETVASFCKKIITWAGEGCNCKLCSLM